MNEMFAGVQQIALPLWRNKWLRRSGVAMLIGLSLLFLGLAIRDAGSAAMLDHVDRGHIAGIALGGIAYAYLLVLLARGWSLTPASLTPDIGYSQAVAVYGTSILPKYIPGSILQYGSRQMLGQRLGWNAKLLAQASLLEVALHIFCSLTVALLLLAPPGAGAAVGLIWYAAVVAAAVAVAVVVLLVVPRSMTTAIMIGSALFQLTFFAGLAALAMLCGALFGVAAATLPAVGGLFLLSWLIGFVVPLAPGGLGIREATGVAFLSGVVGVETALLILASMRIISLIGDVLIFLAGLACQRALHLSSR